MFRVIDKVEDKYFAADATVSPGGWCCNCWCCCSIEIARSLEPSLGAEAPVAP